MVRIKCDVSGKHNMRELLKYRCTQGYHYVRCQTSDFAEVEVLKDSIVVESSYGTYMHPQLMKTNAFQ